MPVTTEKDLPENLRAVWLKAMSAMELRNYGYASQLYQSILRPHPEFLLARQLARKASVAKTAGKKGALGGISSASFSAMKVQSLVKKDPAAAIEAIEKLLEADPYSASVNQLLREAALAAKLPDVAEFALETIIQGNPKDTKTMHELAKLYLSNAKPTKAVDIYGKILLIMPNDLAAIKGGKDAAAAASMQSGGWEKEGADYRDLIRNKDEAISLEQKNRVVRSDEVVDSLIAELSAKLEAEPGNVDVSRRISELYEQKEDLENAFSWYSYTSGLANGADPGLLRKVADLRIKQYDASILQFEEYLAAHPDAPEIETTKAQLADIIKERAKLLLEDAKTRVERNPTDLQVRFELGEIYVNTGLYKEAISELQKARQNPSVRLKAMNLLGRCYTERGMFDLAAETFSTAASEITQMDAVKKEIVYNLGIVYEKMGQAGKSIDCMKQIYAIDASYRDVEERVESSYGAS